MTVEQKAFVAYSSRDKVVAEAVLFAARFANSKPIQVRYEPWEFNDIAGQPVVSPILERIQESTFIVADITYLNLNVVYEIGFAIGAKKRVFLIRNNNVPGDQAIAGQVGIFDTLGYQEYRDGQDLAERLTNYIDPMPLTFTNSGDIKTPVYLVEPPIKDEFAALLTSRIKKARYRYRSFTPSEDSRLSAVDAIRQVSMSAGVFLSLYGPHETWANVHNIRSLFVAGLADGMQKPVLIVAPNTLEIPLDIRDEVKVYTNGEELVSRISEFVPDIADYLQQIDPEPVRLGTSLQLLRMGDPTAENEMTTLSAYYLPTDEYARTLRGEVNLVVGRKGSGKTALFIQVRDRIRADKRNIVVDLKPEGYQLLKLKEDILSYLTEGSRQHLITAFWEYLILLEVAYKLLDKDKHTYKYNHEIFELYRELEATYKSDQISLEGDFSERLYTLSSKIATQYKTNYGTAPDKQLTRNQVSELVYSHDVRKLESQISRYLEKKQAVWVLFDNLDRGWSASGVDVLDSIVLRCLIDAGRKIERDMRRLEHSFSCTVFIRNDVYEHLMQNSSDYGKEMRAVMDWTDPDMMREMLRLRLVSGLGVDKNITFDQIWPKVCVSHYRGDDSASYLIDRSLMRPRNVLKIFGHSRGFANNLNRQVINEDDIEKGLRAYSQDLLVEANHELVDVFPGAKDLLYYFIDAKQEMSLGELETLLDVAGVDGGDQKLVVDFLLYYGIIGLRSNGVDQYIFNVKYDSKVLQIRAEIAGDSLRYIVNPAFWPALNIH